MNDLTDFFSGLFSTDLWPPRWHCGVWSDFHGWLYIVSDMTIWFSYFAIPVIILGYIYKKKFELRYTRTYFLFAAFILLCGSTHLLDAAMFWVPVYRFNALIRFFTAIVSLFTVYHLVKILPDAFRERTTIALEKEIAKREEAESRLRDMNENLKAFAYMASHDLQEPLRKLRLYSERLVSEWANSLGESGIGLTKKINSSSSRMEQLVNGILNLSSISSEIELEELQLQSVIEQAMSDLELKILDTKASISFGEFPMVKGNHAYLVHLFSNLLSNAIKFSKGSPSIEIECGSIPQYTVIKVKDKGIGMRQEDTARIFNAFERLHSKTEFEGSGIGLAICKKIVEAHKGKIEVESAIGQGTTFKIFLPR